jgi:membrane-bound lytic murein transglycosylase B
MITRRTLVAAALAAPLAAPILAPATALASDFDSFIAGVKAEARHDGIAEPVLDAAFATVTLNQKVLDLLNHAPEFTLTWAQYRDKVVNDPRIATGKTVYRQSAGMFEQVQGRFDVDPGVMLGIWGLESNFGATKGNYNVIEALATLAYGSHRQAFFRSELIAALRILQSGDITPSHMLGSYAGAMGQPQFMPSSYLKLAVDFEGNGRRDIWDSKADSVASIANFLSTSGWRGRQPWGQLISVPPQLSSGDTGRDLRRSLGEWMRLGVRRYNGQPFSRSDVMGAVLMPDGQGGDAFMVYSNFHAIRRYNPSDFYALAVGLIGDRILA